jgi:PilZ domain
MPRDQRVHLPAESHANGLATELPAQQKLPEARYMITQQQNRSTSTTAERRAEPRFKAGHAALLITPNVVPMEAWVLDVSSSGLRLRVPEAVAAGTAVRVEAPEMTLFGTIVHCQASHGAYELGVALSQPLELLGQLRKLYGALLAESVAV